MRTRISKSQRLLSAAMGIGAIAGLRSMMAPAVVSWAVQENWIHPRRRKLEFLKGRKTAFTMTALAAGELVADKFPRMPKRTEPAGLATRIVTGGFSAGALCASKKGLVPAGIALGALAAVAGAFIGYATRRKLEERFGWNDWKIALIEDGVAVGGGVLLVRSA